MCVCVCVRMFVHKYIHTCTYIAVWREQINNPNFRLKRGDIILEIDGKALVSVDGVGKLIQGLESSTVTLKIQDSLGVYDATLTR